MTRYALITLCYWLVSMPIFGQSNEGEQPIDSKVERVTVFLQGAQITRTAELVLAANSTSTLVFKDLSSNLDPFTVQVKAEGELTILSVNHRKDFEETPKQPKRLRELKNQEATIKDSIQYLTTLVNILEEEERFMKENRPKSDQIFDFQTYQSTVNFYTARFKEIHLEKLAIARQKTKLQADAAYLKRKYKALNQVKRTESSEVVVKVQSKRATSATLQLSYLSPDAFWSPSYDLKVENINKEIALFYKANVSQKTGEDWKDVLLSFSNANPKKSGIVPNLQANYLNYGNRYTSTYNRTQTIGRGQVLQGKIIDESGQPLIGATILFKGTRIGTTTDINGDYSIIIPNNASEVIISYTGFTSLTIPTWRANGTIPLDEGANLGLEEVVISSSAGSRKEKKATRPTYTPPSTVQNKTTSIEFEMDIPYTVKSDGEIYTVNIQSRELPANYRYQAVPKLEEAAYLTVYIHDWEAYNLLSAPVNLYFENTFIGKSSIDIAQLSDTLEISLGQDRNVQVERLAVKELKKRRFIGNKQIESRAYRVLVRNNKPQAINITILDQVPISRNKEIEVTDIGITKGRLNEETGEISWQPTIAAKSKAQLELRYSVKYPKERYLIVE